MFRDGKDADRLPRTVDSLCVGATSLYGVFSGSTAAVQYLAFQLAARVQ